MTGVDPFRVSFDLKGSGGRGRKVLEAQDHTLHRIAFDPNAPIENVAGTSGAAIEGLATHRHPMWIDDHFGKAHPTDDRSVAGHWREGEVVETLRLGQR